MSFNSRILYQVGTSLRSVLGACADAPAHVPSLRSGYGRRFAAPLACGRAPGLRLWGRVTARLGQRAVGVG